MPKRSSDELPLNERMRAFAKLYVSGPEGVRGIAVAAYRAAGYRPRTENSANSSATKLLHTPKIQRYIVELHQEADREAIARLTDWKTLAPDAQVRLRQILLGRIPDATTDSRMREIRTRDDAAVASILYKTAVFFIHQAYPPQIYAHLYLNGASPRKTLADLVGLDPAQLPTLEEMRAYAANGADAASHTG